MAAPIFLASFHVLQLVIPELFSTFMIDVLLIFFLFLIISHVYIYTDESTSSRANITDDSQSHQYLTLEIVSSQLRAAVSVDGSTVLLVYISSILSLSIDIFCLVMSSSIDD